MGNKIKVNNFGILKECLEKIQTVYVTEESGEDVDFKYINIENLTLIAWKRRFKEKEGPLFEYIQNEKFGKTFLTLKVYQCIEKQNKLEVV